MHIHNSTYAREYERFSLGSPVLADTEVEQNGKEVTILTEQQVIELLMCPSMTKAICSKIGFEESAKI